MIQFIISVSMILLGIASAICLVGSLIFGAKMASEARPDVRRGNLPFNRFNLCAMPDCLTEEGLNARNRYFYFMKGLMLSITTLIIISALRRYL